MKVWKPQPWRPKPPEAEPEERIEALEKEVATLRRTVTDLSHQRADDDGAIEFAERQRRSPLYALAIVVGFFIALALYAACV